VAEETKPLPHPLSSEAHRNKDGRAIGTVKPQAILFLGGGDSPVTARTAALSLTAAPAPAADDLDIQHWIDESFNAAKSTVYKNPSIGRTIYSDSDVQDGGADSRRKAHCSRRGAPREDS
jgi:hypothetical protein